MTAISMTTGGWCYRHAACAAAIRATVAAMRAITAITAATSPRATSRKRPPLKQRISDAEAEIARISGIIAKIDTALALPDLFRRDPKQAAQLSKARAGAASALQRAEEEWLEANSEYDEAAG